MIRTDRLNGTGIPEVRAAAEDTSGAQKLSLGECNPLIYAPDFSRQPHIREAMQIVSQHLIQEHHGKLPTEMNIYTIPAMGAPLDRIVARFQTDSLTEEQIVLLEQLVRQMYRQDVRTRKRLGGSKVDLIHYPEIEMPDKTTLAGKYDRSQLGWYFGPTMFGKIDYSDVGVLIHRHVGSPCLLYTSRCV